MILIPGTTRCPACGQLVYPTDDLFGVRARTGGPPAADGLYHYRCLRTAPFRDAHVAAMRTGLEEALAAADDRTELARSADFAVTREVLAGEYRLHALSHGRWFTVRKGDLVAVLSGLVAGSGNDRVRVEPAGEGASVFLPSVVPVEVAFSARDFPAVRAQLPPLGAKPSADRVNLAAVCERLRVKPSALTCPLPAAVGPVMRGGSDGDTEFTLLATRWQEVDLTAAQFGELKQLAGQALLAV